MSVSENRGTPKSSILIGFSIINHPFWGTPIFGNTHIDVESFEKQMCGRVIFDPKVESIQPLKSDLRFQEVHFFSHGKQFQNPEKSHPMNFN